jgi:hypothetical protein
LEKQAENEKNMSNISGDAFAPESLRPEGGWCLDLAGTTPPRGLEPPRLPPVLTLPTRFCTVPRSTRRWFSGRSGPGRSGRTHIALMSPRHGGYFTADRGTLLHEMVHQFLNETGDNIRHAGAPWCREIMRLTKQITGKEVWAGKYTVKQEPALRPRQPAAPGDRRTQLEAEGNCRLAVVGSASNWGSFNPLLYLRPDADPQAKQSFEGPGPSPGRRSLWLAQISPGCQLPVKGDGGAALLGRQRAGKVSMG